jgi:hypothetical protein
MNISEKNIDIECKSYIINDYNITISLDKSIDKSISLDKLIYIKIINSITYQCFEDNINIQDINLPFTNKNIYSILCRCFNNDKNYNVTFIIDKNYLKLNFVIIFDNEFHTKFDIKLKETIVKDYYKISLNYHKLEDEHNKKIRKLEDRIIKLEDKINCLVNTEQFMYITSPNEGATNYCNHLKLNILELTIGDSSYSMAILPKIEKFYQLHKLILNGSYNHSTIQFINKTLKILVIKTNYLTSLQNLDNLPSLEIIEVHTSTLINIIPFLHKNIKKILFYQDICKKTKEILIEHCTKNNIEIIYIQ